jgi:hypothetical protein
MDEDNCCEKVELQQGKGRRLRCEGGRKEAKGQVALFVLVNLTVGNGEQEKEDEEDEEEKEGEGAAR